MPWNERRHARNRETRSRLDVECRRSSEGGLELIIGYRPEFHHHALSASVSLKSPQDACVYRGQFQDDYDLGNAAGVKAELNEHLRYNGVALFRRDRNLDPTLFQGLVYIEYPDERRGPRRADIRIDILLHGNQLIARHNLTVSPTNEEIWSGSAPHVILDIRKTGPK